MPTLAPLKKAAILLASLDDETADRLLAQMEPEMAARVRLQIVELDEIDPDEQEEILEEFCRGSPPPRDPYPVGIELDSGLAERIAQSPPTLDNGQSPPASTDRARQAFRFLQSAETDSLVESLRSERPQTIALVASHLSAEQAADLIDRLAPALQAQVLRRLSELDETDPEVLREVERYLEARFNEHARSRQRHKAGMQTISAILSAATHAGRGQLVANLAQHDNELALKLGFDAPSAKNKSARTGETDRSLDQPVPQHATQFSDVERLDKHALREVVAQAPPDVLVLALAGASAEFVDRVAACQSARQAKLLRRALKYLGPTRLSEVEQAQQSLARLAGVHLPSTRRGMAALENANSR